MPIIRDEDDSNKSHKLVPSNEPANNYLPNRVEESLEQSLNNMGHEVGLSMITEMEKKLQFLKAKKESEIIFFLEQQYIHKGFPLVEMLGQFYPWKITRDTKYVGLKEWKELEDIPCITHNIHIAIRATAKVRSKLDEEHISYSILEPRDLKIHWVKWEGTFRLWGGWNQQLIENYSHKHADAFQLLSANEYMIWDMPLLKAFTDSWDAEMLLENDMLPWENEGFQQWYVESYGNEEAFEAKKKEHKQNYWSRLSRSRTHEWTADFIRQHQDLLDWNYLSDNLALPFSHALLQEFWEQWDLDIYLLSNPSVYQQVFAPLINDTIAEKLLKIYA